MGKQIICLKKEIRKQETPIFFFKVYNSTNNLKLP